MEIHYATPVNNAVSQRCVSMTHSLNSQFTRAAKGSAPINASRIRCEGRVKLQTACVLKYKTERCSSPR
jgi:hypothetical protein